VLPIDSELLAHRAHGSAYFVVARRGKSASAPSPQHGGRAISDARSWFDLSHYVRDGWHAVLMAAVKSPFGRLILVSGPEGLLADRAIARLCQQMRSESPDVEISEIEAARLDRGMLVEITGPSLFSSRRAAVIYDLENLVPDLGQDLLDLAAAQLADLAIIVVHPGGPKGKGLVDKVKSAGAEVIECGAVKTWELPQFASAEVKRAGSAIDAGAAAALVDAVGHDLRALAAAVTQLISDGQGGAIAVDQVRRYFGGRAEVTSFAVADAALAGRTGTAMEQLRWALATGVAPVLITSALASGIRGLGKLITAGGGQREADLAREVGVPPWKLRSMRSQARGWDQGSLATALKAAAVADAEVKGAADDAAFALERAVLTVSRLRR
jgi:DNA polymerase-3 subunit delta